MSDPLQHPQLAAIPHLCVGCRHAERCAQGLACAALVLFVETGRISPYAPRQPSREVYERIYGPKQPARWSSEQKAIIRAQEAVRATRGRGY